MAFTKATFAKWTWSMVWFFSLPIFAQTNVFNDNHGDIFIIDGSRVAAIERSTHLKDRFNSLLPLLEQGEVEQFVSNLESLPREQYEYLLVLVSKQAMAMDHIDDKLRHWLIELSQSRPHVLVEQQNDGFVLSEPAFDYPALARAALRGWRVNNQHLTFHRQLSQGQLDVKAIFNSNNPYIDDQQESLVKVLPMQNPKRLHWLERELDDPKVFFPDNLVIANMAMLNGSEDLYRRLWLRPVDQHSMKAAWWVKQNYPAEHAFELLWIAAQNSELTEHAWQLMAELKPMPKQAETYLVAALASEEMGEVAAQVLAQLTDHNILSRLVVLVTEGDPANTDTQNAWLSLFLNTSPEAKRLIKQLFELEDIRKNYGPVPQR